MEKYFRTPNQDDMRINTDTFNQNIENSDKKKLQTIKSLLVELKNNNNYNVDIKTLEKFIMNKKTNHSLNGQKFLYSMKSYSNFKYYKPEDFVREVSSVLNSVIDVSGGIKSNINGFNSTYDYDYRITLSNSDNLNDRDIISFVNVFNNHCKVYNIDYGIKVIPDEQDVIIIYLKKNNLNKVLEILETIKINSDFVKNFGEVKPFTATFSKDSYYGISMGATRDVNVSRFTNNLWAQRMQMGKTMTEYTGKLIDMAYYNLEQKYENVDLICAEELYNEMKRLHSLKFNFNIDEDIPIWVNREIYEDFNKPSL